MTPGMLKEIVTCLQCGQYTGGGMAIKSERMSLGIYVAEILYRSFRFLTKFSDGGVYWLLRENFNIIGGFDEDMVSAETIQFSKQLCALGRKKKLKLGYIANERIYTSVRKFDQLGDWYLFKNTREMYKGRNKEVANKVWYDSVR